MKKLTTLLALISSTVLTIPATFEIGWDLRPASEGVTGYTVYLGSTSTMIRLNSVGVTNSARLTFPDGAYRLTVTSTNGVGEADNSLPLYVVVIGTNVFAISERPGAPLNLQLR